MNVKKEILSWLIYILILVAITFLINNFVGQRTHVKGASMEPQLSDGDNLIVDKISYRFRSPERFEIVVFPYRYERGTYYIKRIVGLPGERIQIADGNIYINDERLEESYGLEAMLNPGIASMPVQLLTDEFFVLGDNRNHSMDSRDARVGILRREDLLGRAWVRIWPFDQIGFIPHQ